MQLVHASNPNTIIVAEMAGDRDLVNSHKPKNI